MKLTNARKSIHDAFAMHLNGPEDNIGGGGGKWNSTKWLANAGTAGMIIRAVMMQPATLQGAAVFLNAPETSITQANMIALKQGLWTKFVLQNTVAPAHQGILVAHLDRLMIGYRARVWNRHSTAHTAGLMFNQYAGRKTLTDLSNKLLDILQSFDTASLVPVQAAIDAEQDAESDERKAQEDRRNRVRNYMATGSSFRQAKKIVEAEDAKAEQQTA